MKTTLPKSIKTIHQAKVFLSELFANGESYHPECDAFYALDNNGEDLFTDDEASQLNKLMDEIYDLDGTFDPSTYILELRGHVIE